MHTATTETSERAAREPFGPARPRSYTGRAVAGFLHWLPLLAALGLLAQVGILGLRPALDEQEFLGYERTQVEARNSQMRARFGEVSREVEAWRDPVYLERLRRWRAAQAKN